MHAKTSVSPLPERDSLDFDEPCCPEWEKSLAQEIARREAEAEARGEPLIPHDEVMRNFRARRRHEG
jgi:hypothetical protein